jgi:hypothetical protein
LPGRHERWGLPGIGGYGVVEHRPRAGLLWELRCWYSLGSEDFQILCVPPERIHGRTRGCKVSLLGVREEKYKGKHGGGPGGSLKPNGSVSALQVL